MKACKINDSQLFMNQEVYFVPESQAESKQNAFR